MNSHIVALYVTAQLAFQNLCNRMESDEGQTSVEWLGIAAVAAAVIVALLARAPDIGDLVADKIEAAIGRVAGG
ncbi:hypothetical protein BH24ACT15_BH24ACT15_24680 [soil metagenome]|jgi:hypothetical protein